MQLRDVDDAHLVEVACNCWQADYDVWLHVHYVKMQVLDMSVLYECKRQLHRFGYELDIVFSRHVNLSID
jgi:hypothetical protein